MTAAQDLGVCRWMLECGATAAVVVRHSALGEYPACGEHAADHAEWVRRGEEAKASGRVFIHPSGAVKPQPPHEPGPECYCPDSPRKRMPYCPEHGTKAQRGIDPLADEV